MSVTPADRERFLSAARDVALMAGARVEHWAARRGALKIEEKGAQDLVTEADRATEQLIVEELSRRFPDHTFFGEELAKDSAGARPTWVIDPIDGTNNFVRGIPLYAVSIGLVIDAEVEVGVIHLPRLNETFEATRDGPALLDGKPIRAAATEQLAKATISVGSSRRLPQQPYLAMVKGLTEGGADVRRLGSACVAIAYTACGRLDGFAEQHLNSWDVTAGLCICRSAGARTNQYQQGPWLKDGNAFICAAPGVYDAVEHLALPS